MSERDRLMGSTMPLNMEQVERRGVQGDLRTDRKPLFLDFVSAVICLGGEHVFTGVELANSESSPLYANGKTSRMNTVARLDKGTTMINVEVPKYLSQKRRPTRSRDGADSGAGSSGGGGAGGGGSICDGRQVYMAAKDDEPVRRGGRVRTLRMTQRRYRGLLKGEALGVRRGLVEAALKMLASALNVSEVLRITGQKEPDLK